MKRTFKMKQMLALVAALTVMTACSDSTASLDLFEPEVTNATDSFQLQATGVDRVGTTVQYSWENTGTRASIDHSTTTAGGTARLTIRDAAGSIVYEQDLAPSLNEDTSSGETGTWTITVILSEYSGTLNFRAQKK
jgi:ABC-type uncharacterized transport system auxiliary subunit